MRLARFAEFAVPDRANDQYDEVGRCQQVEDPIVQTYAHLVPFFHQSRFNGTSAHRALGVSTDGKCDQRYENDQKAQYSRTMNFHDSKVVNP